MSTTAEHTQGATRDRIPVGNGDEVKAGEEEGSEDEVDDFLEEMFYNFASAPDDDRCTYAYWSDGQAITRVRVNGVWQYTVVSA